MSKPTIHSNSTNDILTQVLLLKSVSIISSLSWCGLTYSNLEHKLLAVVLGLKGVKNGRKGLGVEFHYYLESEIVPSKQFDNFGDGIQLVMVVEKIFLKLSNAACQSQRQRQCQDSG